MKRILAVVFDMDELIGQFVEAGMFWDALQFYFNDRLTDNDFFNMLDLFPQFFRPNIMTIFNYLKHQKQSRNNVRVYIFTNNQGPKTWAEKIKNYIEAKIHYKLFDRIIGAYMIDNRIVEPCRTSHDKSYKDFINCTGLPDNTKVCFLDDQHHKQMEHDNVYYLNVKAYTYSYKFMDMIHKYMQSNNRPKIEDKVGFINFMMGFLNEYRFTYKTKTVSENNVDKIITKRMMQHIQRFLKQKKPKTHTKRKHKQNKTIKKKN